MNATLFQFIHDTFSSGVMKLHSPLIVEIHGNVIGGFRSYLSLLKTILIDGFGFSTSIEFAYLRLCKALIHLYAIVRAILHVIHVVKAFVYFQSFRNHICQVKIPFCGQRFMVNCKDYINSPILNFMITMICGILKYSLAGVYIDQ